MVQYYENNPVLINGGKVAVKYPFRKIQALLDRFLTASAVQERGFVSQLTAEDIALYIEAENN